MSKVRTVSASTDLFVNTLLSGNAWRGSVTIAFDDALSSNAASLVAGQTPTAPMKLAVRDVFESVASFTNLRISETQASSADIVVAKADGLTLESGSTVWLGGYAFLPADTSLAGDIALGRDLLDDLTPGSFGWRVVLHEVGHALGLKHPNEAGPYGTLPASLDSQERSVMSARTAPGASVAQGLGTEYGGHAETFMVDDIAALQHLYGADYSDRSNTVYRFDPDEHTILRTIWDGGGNDTYDFSRYDADLNVSLVPGHYSVTGQEPQLNRAQELSRGDDPIYADGAIHNARLFKGNTLSLIENARGGRGDDTITGNDARNALWGGAGHDHLLGARGADRLNGNAGADVLNGGNGADTLYGGGENDTLLGGNHDDLLRGENGRDALHGGSGADTLAGGAGNDLLSGQSGRDILQGGSGNDLVYGGEDADRLDGEAGADLLDGGNGADTLIGGLGNDTLAGRNHADVLHGQHGNDHLHGGTGDDTLFGGSENDLLSGQAGSDVLAGGTGDDRLYGGEDDDRLDGEAGADLLDGGRGADMLNGGGGNDTLGGGDDHDLLRGEAGRDTLYGGRGNDTLNGGYAPDFLFGHAGHDVLNGGHGDDQLFGGGYADMLVGGPGADTLTGGDGADLFIFSPGDTITDMTRWDRIDLPTGAVADIRPDGDDLLVILRGSESSMRLEEYRAAQLVDDTFV